MRIAEEALPSGHLATSARLVALDVAYHPGSSISEITDRTGFPQSHVSSSVARLRELGIVETAVDEDDRRRTLVRLTGAAVARAGSRRSEPVDAAITRALGGDDPGEVVGALELLAARLTPRALSHLRDAAAAAVGAEPGDYAREELGA